MAVSPILEIQEVAPTQLDKVPAMNDMIVDLEAALNDFLNVDMSGGNVTLSFTQFARHAVFNCTGLAASDTLTIPQTTPTGGLPAKRVFAVRNLSPTYTVTVKGATGSSVTIPVSGGAVIQSDGANCYQYAAGGPGPPGPAGGAISAQYNFSTTTTNADPGNGFLRLNNATQSSATALYIDLLAADGTDLTAILDTLDSATGTNKGSLRIFDPTASSHWIVFTLTSRTVRTGYREYALTPVSGSTANPFINGQIVAMVFSRTGDQGVIAAVNGSGLVNASGSPTVTVGLGTIASGHVVANVGTAVAAPGDAAMSDLLDVNFGTVEGTFLQRGNTAWGGSTTLGFAGGTLSLAGTLNNIGVIEGGTIDSATITNSTMQGGTLAGTITNAGTILTNGGTAPLILQANTALPGPSPGNTGLWVSARDGASNFIVFDGYNGQVQFLSRRSQGTAGAPAVVTSGNNIMTFSVSGYNGTIYSSPYILYRMQPAENWSASANGLRHMWHTVLNGGTVTAEGMRLEHNGALLIGTTAAVGSEKLRVVGGINTDTLTVTTSFGLPGTVTNSGTLINTGTILNTAGTISGGYMTNGPTIIVTGTTSVPVISNTNAAAPTPYLGTMLQFVNGYAGNQRLEFVNFNGATNINARRSEGTQGAPTATGVNSNILLLAASGYTGAAWTGPGASASITMRSGDTAWTTLSTPTQITFSVTPVGSTVIAEAMRLSSLGDLLIGGTVDSGAKVQITNTNTTVAAVTILQTGAGGGNTNAAEIIQFSSVLPAIQIGMNGLWVAGSDTAATPVRVGVDAFAGGVPRFTSRRARGSSGTLAAVQAGDFLSSLDCFAYDGSAYAAAGEFRRFAINNWSTADHGMGYEWSGIPAGSTTSISPLMRLYGNAHLTINSGTVDNGSMLQVTGDGTNAVQTILQQTSAVGVDGIIIQYGSTNVAFGIGGRAGLRVSGPDTGTSPVFVQVDAFGTPQPGFSTRKFGGSSGAPTAVAANTILGNFSPQGYDGVGVGGASLRQFSINAFTTTDHGIFWDWQGIAAGSTISTSIGRWWGNGHFTVNQGTVDNGSMLQITGDGTNAPVVITQPGTNSGTVSLGSFPAIFNFNTAVPAPITGTALQVVGADASSTAFLLDAFNNGVQFVGRRAQGTEGSPTAIGAGNAMLQFYGIGHDGTVYSANAGGMIIAGDSAWSGSSHPSRIIFNVTQPGSIAITEGMRINSAGVLQVNGSANFPTALTGSREQILAAPFGGTSGGVGGLELVSFGASSAQYAGRQAGGSMGSPSATLANSPLVGVAGYGWATTATWTTTASGAVGIYAAANWATASWPTYISFSVTPSGSTTLAEAMRIAPSGNLLIGTTTDVGYKLDVNGQTRIDTGTGTFTTSFATPLVIGAPDATAPGIAQVGFGNGSIPSMSLYRANGTRSAPSALAGAAGIGNINGFGFGATAYSTNARVQIRFVTSEAWSDSAQGASIVFSATPLGGTLTADMMRLWGSGNLMIGGSLVDTGYRVDLTTSGTFRAGTITLGTLAAISAFDPAFGINSGTLQFDGVQTIAATSTIAITGTPGISSVLVNMGSVAATMDISTTGARDGQRLRTKIVQGATPHLVTLGTTTIQMGTDISTFTASNTANALDDLIFEYCALRTKWLCLGFARGY